MWRWIAHCTIGEACGIAVVAAAYASLERGYLSYAPPTILGAGAWEGLCLGLAQALYLRRFAVSVPRWTTATVTAAVAGYALSLAGGLGAGNGEQPGILIVTGLGMAMGVGMGFVMGVVQWLAARRLLNAMGWAVANAAGWAPAMAIIILTATLASGSWPLWMIGLAGATSGALAGACVGGATWFALPTVKGGQ